MNLRTRVALVSTALIALVTIAGPPMAQAVETEVTFRFRPPAGSKLVTVAGTFNGWNSIETPMADGDRDGLWEVTLRLEPDRYEYKFVVNGTDWYHDESAEESVDNGLGSLNSVVNVGAEPLTVGELREPEAEETGTPVTFSFAPEVVVNSVSLAGSFNDWDAAASIMSDDDQDGLWRITVRLQPGEYAYQFVVDGDRWFTDPGAARHMPDNFGGRDALLEVGLDSLDVGSGANTR